MTETLVVGKTYREHLREVRAKQFGYKREVIESIDTLPNVSVAKKASKKKKEKE